MLKRRIAQALVVLLGAMFFPLCAGADDARPPTRILFGSCNKPWREQPLWKPILANKPDLWIWLGDIIYASTESMAAMKEKYDQQKAKPDYQQLRATCPIVGVWDDNDYGQNDGGKNYPMKSESQKLLLDFLDEPPASPRRKQDGVQTAVTYGPPGMEIKVILLDGRSHRDDPGPNADPLGDEQWRWLERQLIGSSAQIHLIGSGSQVIACEHPFEKWADFPAARQRLLDLIAKTRPRGAVLISGDRHLGEISRLNDSKLGYPLYDVTSSGLTHHVASGWRNFFYDFKKEPNRYRVGDNFLGCNFGMIEVDWGVSPPKVKLQIRDGENAVRVEAVASF